MCAPSIQSWPVVQIPLIWGQNGSEFGIRGYVNVHFMHILATGAPSIRESEANTHSYRTPIPKRNESFSCQFGQSKLKFPRPTTNLGVDLFYIDVNKRTRNNFR